MPTTKKTKPEAESEGPLVAAAKAIGKVAGTVASTLGVHGDAAPAARVSRPVAGKLPKKNKSRLPRRQKKALKRTKNVT